MDKKWNDAERRRQDEGRWEFERDVIMFMARIDERLDNNDDSCADHKVTTKGLSQRVSSLEDFRNIVIWTFKLAGYGAASVGTVYGAIIGALKLATIVAHKG